MYVFPILIIFDFGAGYHKFSKLLQSPCGNFPPRHRAPLDAGAFSFLTPIREDTDRRSACALVRSPPPGFLLR
jgi:hypothetical protein